MQLPDMFRRRPKSARTYMSLDGSEPGTSGIRRLMSTPAFIVNTVLAFSFAAAEVATSRPDETASFFMRYLYQAFGLNIRNPQAKLLMEISAEFIDAGMSTMAALFLFRVSAPVHKESVIDRSRKAVIDIAPTLKMINHYKIWGCAFAGWSLPTGPLATGKILDQSLTSYISIGAHASYSLLLSTMCLYAAVKLSKGDWRVRGSLRNNRGNDGPPPQTDTAAAQSGVRRVASSALAYT